MMPVMYTKILVPLDGSPTAMLALDQAAAIARMAGASLQLLHVIDAVPASSGFARPAIYLDEIQPRLRQEAETLLEQAADGLRKQGATVETTVLESRGDRVSEIIADTARQSGVDLIVLGTHGRRGVQRLLIGSDAEQVARIAPVPVLLVRERA